MIFSNYDYFFFYTYIHLYIQYIVYILLFRSKMFRTMQDDVRTMILMFSFSKLFSLYKLPPPPKKCISRKRQTERNGKRWRVSVITYIHTYVVYIYIFFFYSSVKYLIKIMDINYLFTAHRNAFRKNCESKQD